MTTKFGDFAAPLFNAVGDQYDGKARVDKVDKGLALKVSTSKAGKVRPALSARRIAQWHQI